MDLSRLKNLELLLVTTPRKSEDFLTDADLACLAKLKKLKSIQTRHGAISGEGLKHLVGLPNIDKLSLGGPNLKDEDFRYFSNMKKLSTLIVSGGRLTDACLKHLESSLLLGNLSIFVESDITDEALKRLQAKLPNLDIVRIHKNEHKDK